MRRYPNLFVFSSLLTVISCSTSDPAAPNSGGSGGSASPTGGASGAPVNPTAGTPTFGGNPPAGGGKGTAGTMTGSGGSTPGGGGTGSGGVPGNTGGTPQGTSGAPTSGAGGSADGPITGYFTSGTWKGFAWTATFGTGNTVMPANFAGVENWPVCASGTVKGDEKGANGAMVGWNLNQERAKDSPLGTITPGKAGINVSITAKTQAQLRLQIQAADGETNAAHRWCAEIGTGGANLFVPYESFNTECWPGGKGTAYDKSVPLSQAIVQIPSAKADVPFDFCIDSIAEADGAGMAGMGCDLNSATSGSPVMGSLPASNKFARVATNTGSPVIYVQNNIFGQGGQYDISYNGPSFTVTNFTGSAPTNGAPMGYPSLFIGSAGGDGQATTGSNLAKQVNALTDIPTAWRWSGTGTEFNVAYDVWFAPGAGDAGQGSRSFLMVWFHKTANVFAEGEGEGHSGGVFTVGGKSFNTYVSQQFEGRPIISYVATNISEWSFDLNDFITDAKTRTSTAQPTPVINNNLYLTNVFAGFEVWSGVSNLKTDKFCIQVK